MLPNDICWSIPPANSNRVLFSIYNAALFLSHLLSHPSSPSSPPPSFLFAYNTLYNVCSVCEKRTKQEKWLYALQSQHFCVGCGRERGSSPRAYPQEKTYISCSTSAIYTLGVVFCLLSFAFKVVSSIFARYPFLLFHINSIKKVLTSLKIR